jgi:hypothetical protein
MSASPASPQSTSDRSGWVTFAAVLFILVGAFNLLDGIVALVNDDYFSADELLFGDLSAWGVWWLIVGTAQAGTGLAMLARTSLSLVFAILIATVNAITQLLWIGVYPAWAIAAIILDGLIVWVLTVHADEFD